MNIGSHVWNAADRFPNRVAVVVGDESTTYAKLRETGLAVAMMLKNRGVKAGDRVAFSGHKTEISIAIMQATLWLGAAYVPVDPLSPTERAQYVLTDCNVKVFLADRATIERVATGPLASLACIRTDEGFGNVERSLLLAAAEAEGFSPREMQPNDLAYILYTSGSTGRPKGVCISHLNSEAFFLWAAEELDIGPDDRLSNHAAFHFDLSVFDLYAAFARGASVHLVPDRAAYAPARLVSFIQEHRITVWYSVPSVLSLMVEEGGLAGAPHHLRAVIFAGEPFPLPKARAFAAAVGPTRLLNFYGPTETNVCTFHEVRHADLADDSKGIPIGIACSGDETWVELEDGTRAGVGEGGELCVSGPTVMLGYWGKAGVPSTVYRTGDIVRILADGSYLFSGRRDHMVKVRGHRVELGEVETVLERHPSVSEVAVVVRGEGREAKMVAHVVCKTDTNLLSLKRHCAERLPPHMIIHEVKYWSVPLPRTRNGKVDRKALMEEPLVAAPRAINASS